MRPVERARRLFKKLEYYVPNESSLDPGLRDDLALFIEEYITLKKFYEENKQ